jgi:hypothetical protein
LGAASSRGYTTSNLTAQATELAISVVEQKCSTTMASHRKMAANKRAHWKKHNDKRVDRVERKRETVSDLTYGNFDTTVFDVRRDFIRLMNDMKTGSLNSKLSRRRVSAIKMIVKEVRQRIEGASRTLPQALGDLEMMRLKFYG